EVDLILTPLRARGCIPLLELADDIRLARDRDQGGNPVVVAHELVGDRAGLDHAGPADQAWYAEGALPVGVLLGAEVRHRAVRPRIHVRAIVAAVDNDRIVGDAHVIQRLEQRSDGLVVLDHAVDVLAVAMLILAAVLGTDVGPQVHARAIPPDKKWL